MIAQIFFSRILLIIIIKDQSRRNIYHCINLRHGTKDVLLRKVTDKERTHYKRYRVYRKIRHLDAKAKTNDYY